MNIAEVFKEAFRATEESGRRIGFEEVYYRDPCDLVDAINRSGHFFSLFEIVRDEAGDLWVKVGKEE